MPCLTLFTWLTNTGAFGLALLMVLVSIAVIGYFRRDRRGVGVGSRLVAPLIAAVSLGGVAVLILVNFDVLLGQAESNALTYLLPAIVVVPACSAMLWAYRLGARGPTSTAASATATTTPRRRTWARKRESAAPSNRSHDS